MNSPIRKFQFVLDDPENLQKFDAVKNQNRFSEDKEVIALALKRLFEEYAVPEKVAPLHKYKKRLKNLTGVVGPYIVEELRHSSLGLSKGLYKLQDCEALLPVDWFTPISPTQTRQKRLAYSLVGIIALIVGYTCIFRSSTKEVLMSSPAAISIVDRR